jgi:hypothetical protein
MKSFPDSSSFDFEPASLPPGRNSLNDSSTELARPVSPPFSKEKVSGSHQTELSVATAAANAKLARLLFGQSVTSFNEAPNKISSFSRSQVVSLLDSLRVIGQVRIIYRIAKPSRVVAASEVKQPCFFVDALRNLTEDRQIVSLEIVALGRAAEIKAAIPHVALGVFPEMPQSLNGARDDSHRERRFSAAREPYDCVSALVR